MSTIATTPLSAPSSSGTKPLVIGLGVVAVVMTGIVVAQNVDLPTSTTSSSTTSTDVRAGGPDALEARARSAQVRAGGPDALAARSQAEAARVERQLDGLVKSQGNYAGTAADSSSYRVGGSTWLSQVPAAAAAAGVVSLRADTVVNGLAYGGRGYGSTSIAVPSLRVDTVVGGRPYGGRGYGSAGAVAGISSLEKAQVGGLHPTYPMSQSGTHQVWNDAYVPPYENPEWMPLIQKHYFGARSGE